MKSHSVPQRLLKQFAYHDPTTDSLRLWRYAKGRPPYPKASPKTAARIDGYFADPRNAAIEQRVEEKLAVDVEDPVNQFLASFDDKMWVMSDLQRRQMTRYVNLLFNRCMARREAMKHSQELTAYALQKFLDNKDQLLTVATHWNLNAFFEGIRLSRLFTPDDVDQKAREQLVKSQTESSRQESFVQNVANAMASPYAAQLESAMFQGAWNVLRTTHDDPFILSDTPVVTWERVGEQQFNYGIGFERPNVEVLLPLSPVACFQILPAVTRTRPCVSPTPREINIAQAAFSHQACFANQNRKEIDDLVQSCIHKVQLGRNAFTLWHRNFDDMFFDALMR
jgi:hypothetical protein